MDGKNLLLLQIDAKLKIKLNFFPDMFLDLHWELYRKNYGEFRSRVFHLRLITISIKAQSIWYENIKWKNVKNGLNKDIVKIFVFVLKLYTYQ